jgi:hypothetical protein
VFSKKVSAIDLAAVLDRAAALAGSRLKGAGGGLAATSLLVLGAQLVLLDELRHVPSEAATSSSSPYSGVPAAWEEAWLAPLRVLLRGVSYAKPEWTDDRGESA